MKEKEIKRLLEASMIHKSYARPTDEDIARVIERLEKCLAEKAINRSVNLGIKEGYTRSVELLKSRTTDLTKSSIGYLQTVQGRAIAMCAIDYMKGMRGDDILGGVTIKKM